MSMTDKALTRRHFVAGAAVAAAGTVAASSAAAPQAQAADATEATDTVPTIFKENPAWLGEAPEMPAEFEDESEADIVVVGCGHSGAACARHAAELGKSVIVLEQQDDDIETFMILGQAIGHINSQWQFDQGVPEYDVAEFVHNWQLHCANRANG